MSWWGFLGLLVVGAWGLWLFGVAPFHKESQTKDHRPHRSDLAGEAADGQNLFGTDDDREE